MPCTQPRIWLTAISISISISMSVVGCTSAEAVTAPVPPAEPANSPALEQARAFQLEYDKQLREDEHSFLTVVAAYYLAPGEQLELAQVDGAWAPRNERDAPNLRFEATPKQLLIHGMNGMNGMNGADELAIAETTRIPAGDDGRFSFGISPQSDSWRVQIHDREAELRASFPGIAWFPVDGDVIVEARFEAAPVREATELQTSRGVTKTLYAVGEVQFELDGHPLSLQAFGYAPAPAPDEPLLIPFRDETSGHQSYAAGRYLELLAPTGDTLQLDFNRATNPLCAYSEHFNCPMPPRFNTLSVAIQAGAMAPQAAH